MAETEKHGTFYKNLTKNFSQIKAERAESVTEDVEIEYRRYIEDICKKIRDADRGYQSLLLNLAPETSFKNTVVPPSFDAHAFMTEEEHLGIDRRNLIIRLEIMLSRYEYHFGAFPEPDTVKKVFPEWKSVGSEESDNVINNEEA